MKPPRLSAPVVSGLVIGQPGRRSGRRHPSFSIPRPTVAERQVRVRPPRRHPMATVLVGMRTPAGLLPSAQVDARTGECQEATEEVATEGTAAVNASASGNRTQGLAYYLGVVKRRKWAALPLIVLTPAAVLLFSLHQASNYRATAQVPPESAGCRLGRHTGPESDLRRRRRAICSDAGGHRRLTPSGAESRRRSGDSGPQRGQLRA